MGAAFIAKKDMEAAHGVAIAKKEAELEAADAALESANGILDIAEAELATVQGSYTSALQEIERLESVSAVLEDSLEQTRNDAAVAAADAALLLQETKDAAGAAAAVAADAAAAAAAD